MTISKSQIKLTVREFHISQLVDFTKSLLSVHADSVIQMIQDVPGTGLIGLGPSKGSAILGLLNSSAGDPPLDRIFEQNTSTPNILTILLSRNEENSTVPEKSNQLVPLLEDQPGQITIGEVIEGYEEVAEQPKLPALVDGSGLNQHWMTLLDSNGIIGPDGNRINTTSSKSNLTEGKSDQLRVVFDSGFSFPQVCLFDGMFSQPANHHL